MAESHVPQPRYSQEYKAKAAEREMPLFTFDLYWYPMKSRHTRTGVMNAEDAAEIIAMIQRALAKEPR